eukprot:CAMPEP_0175440558 /NCGR_PEP_ID=MMETSP0095-20121207/57134_1 /TAXON_ID=311494 /ORGANISM="Alexandrium monilatum, Strain CCMP3105" /LENGTH=49 /DNA_ID= /DNA_START= /DNA_END= /DNA_ORIENTATION=
MGRCAACGVTRVANELQADSDDCASGWSALSNGQVLLRKPSHADAARVL